MNKDNITLKKNSQLIPLFGYLSIISIDQLVKHKIRQSGGFYVCNEGISLGIKPFPVLFWLILIILLSLALMQYYKLYKKGLLSIPYLLAFILVLGGASSNIIDRLLFGCVFDYIFTFWKQLPIFNFADISIFTGICLFIFISHRKEVTNCA